MTIKEVYDRYKHLDKLLSDRSFYNDPMQICLYHCWQAIKDWNVDRAEVSCGYTGGCGSRSNGRCDLDEQCEKFAAAPNPKEINRCPNIFCVDNFQAANGNFCSCDSQSVDCRALEAYRKADTKCPSPDIVCGYRREAVHEICIRGDVHNCRLASRGGEP